MIFRFLAFLALCLFSPIACGAVGGTIPCDKEGNCLENVRARFNLQANHMLGMLSDPVRYQKLVDSGIPKEKLDKLTIDLNDIMNPDQVMDNPVTMPYP